MHPEFTAIDQVTKSDKDKAVMRKDVSIMNKGIGSKGIGGIGSKAVSMLQEGIGSGSGEGV